MIQTLFRHLLIPAFEGGIKRRNTFRYLRELQRTQWLDPQQIAQLQSAALANLLRHAHEHCSYYREAWLSLGIQFQQVQTVDDLCRLPVIDRETIRAHRPAMRSEVSGRLITKSTGGSSGVPLTFEIDRNSNDRRTAAWHRGYAWASAAPGTRQFYLWGTDLCERSARQRLKESLWNRLYRKTVCSSFGLTESSVRQIADQISRCRPHAIVAYVKPLYELARCLEAQSIQTFSPRTIVVGAEKLHPFERDTIERVFRTPVFETYGSREFMLIAAECEQHRGMHLTSEQLIVELLDENDRPVKAGEEGQVVVTDLFNYGMPFIRYRTGDLAIAEDRPCACGRGLPMLRRVIGRQLDIIRTVDGRLIPGEFFPHMLKDFAAVRQFQVVQRSIDHVCLRMVIEPSFDRAARETIERLIRQRLGTMTTFTIEHVDSIPLTPAGKRRVVVSELATGRAA